ncbi:ArsA family ATPase [Prosthecochloris sp. N3]|uniref:arsenite-transporting ATPase n=1 Tax=Prosthecochloris ethylica TaxID=2743976 RepID=A0ABR9XS82_9CHLB|nr:MULTISPECIES: TRC40/GET3/ArsA family transport-energizing ATPase [Prosthecochloris]MEC9487045.1 TRC40/GET3/ArsA family transport-energizing ATPase [Prosthecochloris sp.]MBF0585379.1 ArsA family ATPase [Prosthecochloris ethylica]MBF0636915.1 ArsA family ATPase [Prosthecochloris ethylica]NUK46608.1 ArsA family ATPase [Prosthecochloris ethylica]RNA64778.1 arsenic-transporting ATPase [Prosthecochloris sp. ZM_2]
MRNIIFTGKGGVGKTSVAAATALKAADMGYRTLIMSTDPAHSLGDSLDVQLGPSPVKVTDNLWGQEVSVFGDLNLNWDVVREHFAQLMESRGVEGIYAEEMGVLPGMEELFSLSYIKRYNEEQNDFDLLVVDCAPTGETLRLLSLPETFGWFIKMIRNVEKYMVKPVIRPLSKKVKKIDAMVAPEEVYEKVDNLFASTEGIIDLLADGSKSTVRLVMNPEKMVIKESMRALTYLNLYGITVDSITVNRVMPDLTDNTYFKKWRDIQQNYIQQIEDAFAPIPIGQVPLFEQEVVGLDMLRQVGAKVYGDNNPTEVFFEEDPIDIQKVHDGHYKVRIKLPFMEAMGQEPKILKLGDDLTIRIGDYQKVVALPIFIAGLESSGASFDNGWLTIDFIREDAE